MPRVLILAVRQVPSMKWFKNIFSAKTAHENPGETMTSQELGDYLFGMCVRWVGSFLDIWEESIKKRGLGSASRDSINKVELLIAFMWSCFDLLQEEKYLDSLTRMHGRFRQHMNELNLDPNEMWRLLQVRYDEYLQSHRAEGKVDFTYKRAAWKISENIYDGPDVLLEFQVTISLQKIVLHIGQNIKKQK